MCRIGRRGREHELCVGCDLQVARSIAGIYDRQATDFGVVLRRNNHFQDRGDRGIAANEFRSIFGEVYFVAVGLDAARLIAAGPHSAAFDVAQKDIATGIVACEIFAPTRDAKIAPATEAGAGAREHHRIAPVREQMGLRRRFARRMKSPRFRNLYIADARRGRRLLRPGVAPPRRRAVCAPATAARSPVCSVAHETVRASSR